MKKIFTLLLLLSAFVSHAQRTMFTSQNNYVEPVVPARIITTDLLLYLDADNPASYSGTGNMWNDLSGNNNHGTLHANNSGSLPVYQNGSLYFNGSTSYVSIVSSVIPNTSSWTLSTWVKSPLVDQQK